MEAAIPRDSQGTYSLPPNTLVNSGDTILVSQHNPAMLDIAAAFTGSLARNGVGGMLATLNMNSNFIANLAPGVNPNDAATVSQLGSSGTPVGAIVDYAGSTAPDGWLFCGGQSVSRETYANLFAVIGTLYGSASSTTFNLPDLRGRVAAGMDFSVGGSLASRLTNTRMTPDGATLGANGGAQSVTLTTEQLAAHTHDLDGTTSSAGAHTHSYVGLSGSVGSFGGDAPSEGVDTTGSAGEHTHTLEGSVASAGGGQAHSNVQPTLIMNKIIRTGLV